MCSATPSMILQHHDAFPQVPYLEFLAKFNALPDAEIMVGTIQASINHGRWIAECPTVCGGAVVPELSTPIFLCPACGGGWYGIEFPKDKAEIERLLLLRPLIATRNWHPRETVDMLIADNQHYGVGV